jgi:hypothetical protein
MSQYRDSLRDPETRAAYDACTANAGRCYAAGAEAMHALAAAEGPQAVAEHAWYPGHPMTKAQIAALYDQMYGQAGARAA